MAGTTEIDGILKGAVNARLFGEIYQMQEAVLVSPKFLSPEGKRERWNTVWLQVGFE